MGIVIRFIDIQKRRLIFVLLGTLLTMWLSVAFSECVHAFADTLTTESSCPCCPPVVPTPSMDHCAEVSACCTSFLLITESLLLSSATSSPDQKNDVKIVFPASVIFKTSGRESALLGKYSVRVINDLPTLPALRFRKLLI
jgi:hypothetical protein